MSDSSSDSLPDDISRSAAWLHVQVDKDSEVEMDSSEPFLPKNEGFQVSRLIRHTPEGTLESLNVYVYHAFFPFLGYFLHVSSGRGQLHLTLW